MPATSNAAWWIKKPKATWTQKKRKHSVLSSFSQDMAELFRNISMHGYSKLVAPQLSFTEKLIWLAVHMATMCILMTVLSMVWETFVAQYIVINLHNPLFPVELIAFPAISICSNNRISRLAAMQYADTLSLKDPQNRTSEYFLRRLKYFSGFYYKQNREFKFEELPTFQAFLDTYDTWDNETFYNTRRIARMLTPDCEHYLRVCKLAGVDIDCFDKKAFRPSLTVYGDCCTFNLDNSYQIRQYREQFVQPELGLTVVLNTSRADYFMPILSINGYIVIVHDPQEFADTQSGEAQEIMVSSGMESFLAIKARKVDTDDTLRSFGPKTRKCYFHDEHGTDSLAIKADYSFSNCITHCRTLSILALCRCLPYFMPLDVINEKSRLIYCTLEHLQCLFTYNFKWTNVLTKREQLPGLERALEVALFCPQCMPACNDVQHQLSITSLPIDGYHERLTTEQWEQIGLDAADMSVLHVHFDEPYAKYYRRMVGNTWFEALCTVGNVNNIFLGFSIVAVFEIVYFFVKYVAIGIKSSFKQSRRNRRKEKSAEMKLYICP